VFENTESTERQYALRRRAVFVTQLLEHGRVQQGEGKFRRKSGELGDHLISAEIIRLDGEQYLLAMIQDISERKRLEERLRHTHKMEGIGHLAGGLAHEFNNILSAMMMNLDLVRTKSQDTEANEALGELEILSARAAGLVRQLLAFSRKNPMHAQSVDLREIVGRFAKSACSVMESHIVVDFKPPAELSTVQADKGMIEQMLMNMWLNSRDAMPKGGRLTLKLEECLITAEHARTHQDARPGRFVSLSVTDIGCGISESARRRLFEPFFTTKKVGQAQGLGLAAVYGIIQQHNGWIEVDSEVGRGSTFRILLPCEVAQPIVALLPKTPVLRQGGNETILLVEDEPSLRKVLCRFLRQSGYRMLEASNATEALKVWGDHLQEIDLLFTDMTMPGGMNGSELCRRLRQDKPELKVIISSGYHVDRGEREDATDAHILYLPKPCASTAVIGAIKSCFEGSSLDMISPA
jgi:signal transduction histidine kinase/CheY-like chemotaxis protein